MSSSKSLKAVGKQIVLVVIFLTILFSLFRMMTVYAAGPILDISKEFFGKETTLEVVPGSEFTYYITYHCDSTNQDCTNVSLVDNLPSQVEYVRHSAPPAHVQSSNYDSGSHRVTFNFVEPLPADTWGEVEITVKFPDSTPYTTTAVNSATSTTDGGTDISTA